MALTRPRTHYAKSGDVSIAYQAFGKGPFDLIEIPGFISNVEVNWEQPTRRYALENSATYARTIIMDKRGTGLSDPCIGVPTLEQRIADLKAVLDEVGSERVALFGISEGGPMALLFAATYPDMTEALVLYGTTPRFSTGPDWPWGWSEADCEWMWREIDQSWGEGALAGLFMPSQADNPEALEAWGQMQRACASPGMAKALLQAAAEIDVRELLPTVQAPTLVMHMKGERVARVEGARYIAENVANGKIIEFEGEDHLGPLFGGIEPLVDATEEFLTGHRRGGRSDRMLATIMFTDIVDSTKYASELGDRRWRELLERHDRTVRAELARFAGHEVKTMGDGFLATFDGPARGIECACSIRDAVRRLDVQIRAGLHTGECELIGDDVGGIAVNIGARVGAKAGPGEVLVSRTVTDLVAGSGLEFEPRGSHELKGVPGEWQLFSVRS
jgi:class 3 adenylate cyclase/pimeloyl-ACP methyl ester carboxylesterase